MIEARDVHKSYRVDGREVRAVRGVSLRLDRGAFAVIVGPSGSGKSTLLHLLGALDRPTSGQVLVDGRDLCALGERERSAFRRERVGFVFQSFNLIANLTALENVLVPWIPRGIGEARRRKARALLDRMGLADRADHRPGQLSGGEQQRVAIARAILKEPLLLLADEPTGELDSESGAAVWALMREMNRGTGTILVVATHDTRFLQAGDEVRRLLDGRWADGG
jgi:putative ABC transport system ATP-binding protein